jgi:hypothetical protein
MAADMAEIAVTLEGMLSKDMPRPAMSGVDTLDSVLAVDVVTNLRGPHAGTAAMQRAHIIGMAAVTGEAVTGEAVTGEAITGIRPMDILGSAITAWAMATHTMEVATTVTVMVGIIRTTEIGDTTLTSTDTGRP